MNTQVREGQKVAEETGTLGRWDRWVPLTGLAFAVLFAAGMAIAIVNNSPASAASGKTVISFYQSHGSALNVDAILVAFAFLFLLFFSGSLRVYLRRSPQAEGLAALVPSTAAVLLAGVTIYFGFDYTLANAPKDLSPAAAQALNVLSNNLYLTQAAGACAFGIITGLAILRAALLPRWLGWLAIAIGIVVLTPVDYVAFMAMPIWAAVTSVLMVTRSGQVVSERPREELGIQAAL
jgi:hypothetical protein